MSLSKALTRLLRPVSGNYISSRGGSRASFFTNSRINTNITHNRIHLKAFYTAKQQFSTTSTTETPKEIPNNTPKKKLGALDYFRLYGRPFLIVYLTTYITFLLAIFLGISVSSYQAQDLITYFKSFEFLNGRALNFMEGLSDKYPSLSNFAAAWCATKFTEPIRIFITISIITYLVKKGKIRPNKAALMLPLMIVQDEQ